MKGKLIGKFLGHEGDVWAVTTSPDGRLLVSGSADQTIRLWNLQTRELIVTLFHGADGEWVMWTPQGYYTGSPGSDKIVGWQINKGLDKTADYRRCRAASAALEPARHRRARHHSGLGRAGRARGAGHHLQAGRPAGAAGTALPHRRTGLRVRSSGAAAAWLRSSIEATPDPIKAIRVQVNGRQVEEKTATLDSGGFAAGEQLLDVPLGKGRNDVRVTLTNAIGERAETVTVMQDGDGALDKRGTLYILAIGVDKYPGLGETCGRFGTSSCDLSFPSADARAIAEAVEKRLGPAHNGVVKRVLVNGAGKENEPTAANILDAIDLLKQAKETDTIVLFIAGHGFNDGPNYRFLPTNAELAGGTLRGSTVVSWHVAAGGGGDGQGPAHPVRRHLPLRQCLQPAPRQRRLPRQHHRLHGRALRPGGDRGSQARARPLHVCGGRGPATASGDLAAKRQLSTKELGEYVIKRVEELAKALQGAQEPQYFKGRDAEDYVLVRW